MKFLKDATKMFVAKLVNASVGETRKREILWEIDDNESLRSLAESQLSLRALVKENLGLPIRVLFIVHEPTLWKSFSELYRLLSGDSRFDPRVLVLERKDMPDRAKFEELHRVLNAAGVRCLDAKSNSPISSQGCVPDYVFHQIPYSVYPETWSAQQLSRVSRICYIPYGTTIFSGDVYSVTHPVDYFRIANLLFIECSEAAKLLRSHFADYTWFDERSVFVVGNTKMPDGDAINIQEANAGNQAFKTILWTPRWRTCEDTCTFFEYRDFLIDYFTVHSNQKFIFRPHPLAFDNFVKEGEMSSAEINALRTKFGVMDNLVLDETPDYTAKFEEADLLISDLSSLMLEFFVTGKPIIYTHRRDFLNSLGRLIEPGLYKATNQRELRDCLDMLASGNDPLRDLREKIIKTVDLGVRRSPAAEIIEVLKQDWEGLSRSVESWPSEAEKETTQ